MVGVMLCWSELQHFLDKKSKHLKLESLVDTNLIKFQSQKKLMFGCCKQCSGIGILQNKNAPASDSLRVRSEALCQLNPSLIYVFQGAIATGTNWLNLIWPASTLKDISFMMAHHMKINDQIQLLHPMNMKRLR
jgi:hypothetical protein